MTKTLSSRRISSAMASRKASRTVWVTNSVPAGISPEASWASTGAGAAWTMAGAAGAAGAAAGTAGAAAAAGAGADSPSPWMKAILVLTATLSVPSGTRIWVRTPSSMASTSIVEGVLTQILEPEGTDNVAVNT